MKKKITVDYKTTQWCRLNLENSKSVDDLIELFNTGYLPSEGIDNAVYEDLYDTSEYITPSENDNQSTIEIYEDHKLM